ncbi:MAG TPA: hypothetical protein VNS58_18435 [Puia sp.]|nr:hypothetical protein [Puia sp.]
MKTIMTLFLAVMACYFSYAQTDKQTRVEPPGKTHPLDHADSLAMIDAGVLVLPLSKADLSKASDHPVIDSLAIADSLARVDSILRSRTKVRPFPEVIQTVLTDFPFNLRNITGELVLAQGEFENYTSLVQLAEAGRCTITRYHSVDDTTVSWQAKINRYDEYGAAARQYHELYKKLEQCYLRLVDGSIIYLQGVWEPAKEGTAFTTSTLRLTTGDWRYKEVKVELELVYLLAEWEVNINILTKKRDDEVGGGIQ